MQRKVYYEQIIGRVMRNVLVSTDVIYIIGVYHYGIVVERDLTELVNLAVKDMLMLELVRKVIISGSGGGNFNRELHYEGNIFVFMVCDVVHA